MSQNKRYTKAEIKAQIKEIKRMKALAVQRNIVVFALLVMLVLGLVSTTFSTFVTENTGDSGSLVADIQTLAINQGNKDQVASLGANTDVSSTGASIKGYIYYDNTYTKWSSVQVMIGHGSWSEGYVMTKIANTNLWYYNMSSSWDNATQIAVFNSSSKWGSEGNSVSHRCGYMDQNSACKTFSTSYTSGLLLYGTSGDDNFTLSMSSATYSGLNTTQTATVQSAEYGSSSYSNDSAAGSTTISTYKMNSVTAATSSTGTTSASAARSATVTMTATANSGYTFVGWYNTGNVQQTTSTTFTYTCSGSETTYYARFQKVPYEYTVTANTGGKVSPTGGTVNAGSSVSITATPNDGYTFINWSNATNGTVGSTASATTTFTPTANNASVKANFRPDAPSTITLTGSNVASGTSGTGTSANPFIVFDDGGFTLKAEADVVTGATAHYSTTASSGYSTTNTFSPALTTKGTSLSYNVYAKAYAGGYYSTNPLSATAHYMVFSHLNGANTGFTMSSDSITDIDTVTFSGAYVNGPVEAEKTYITQTYQVSTDNSTFSNISGSTWTPDAIGTYYFRLKTTNIKTGETVYSDSQLVTVTQSTVYYDITVVNDGKIDGKVTLKADGVTITDGKILSNSKLTVSLARPNSNYYIEYLDVDTISEFDNMNVNGDISDYVAYDHVKGNVTISYKLSEKPKVTVSKPANSSAIEFAYYLDGAVTKATTAGTYYVDYNERIRYSVTPDTGYYVMSMTGVTIGEISASTVVGAMNNVVSDIASVTATLVNNNTVTVSIDSTSAVTEGGTMTIDGDAHSFGVAKALNYGTESTIIVTPPEGYYAVVSGSDITPNISTDGKSTFDVILKGTNKTYTVKFMANPKIFMVQPQYGSVYVTDEIGNYYFNGDSVGYGTELTVYAKPDHANAKFSNVLINNLSIGTVDGSTFSIVEDSTATATITVDAKHSFDEGTVYGTRRIFFTDNSGWGDNQVMVHYSNSNNDTNFSDGNVKEMTFKFVNDSSQRVYYADIPYSYKYVNFYKKSSTTSYTASALIGTEANAFWHGGGTSPYAINTWQENYSDYIATDRADTIQQATTSKGTAATFQYTCDFGDDALSAKVVSGNSCTFDFDKGTLSITPTANTDNYSLVEVKSSASTTVKYYLIRVENFEILSFTGLQKIYKANVLNNIQLDLILKGGVLNYAAELFVSDTNAAGSYTAITPDETSGFSKIDSLEAYINSFLIKYSLSGPKYFKVNASDGAGHKATATAKTLFGTNTYDGERVLYFYNYTNVNLSKYKLRACFMDAKSNESTIKTFVTMQQVGDTDYYRAVIPENAYGYVNFYLCNPKTFSNNFADFDGTDDTTEFYSFGVLNAEIPKVGSTNEANIVFKANSIDTENGITGEFVDFDY